MCVGTGNGEKSEIYLSLHPRANVLLVGYLYWNGGSNKIKISLSSETLHSHMQVFFNEILIQD